MKLAKSVFRDVELVKVGDWKAGTGRHKITREHLAAAVEAYKDSEVDSPVIKLGHVGGLALGDSLPAAGWVTNPRLSADGNTLIGEMSDVPSKLAAIIPTAFKRRSVEMSIGVTTPSGRKYAAALTGLALLGAQAPAVKGLSDVLEIYASEHQDDGDGTNRESVVELAFDESDTPPVPHGETGGGEPQTVDTNSAGKDSKVANLSPEKLKELRTEHKLNDDATEAEILAAVTAAKDAATQSGDKTAEEEAKPAEKTGEQKPAEKEGDKPAEHAGQEQVAASSGSNGVKTVMLSESVWSETQTQLSELLEDKRIRTREDLFLSAMNEGKISPADEKRLREQYEKNPDGVAFHLSQLTPGRIALSERGADHAPNADNGPEWSDEELAKIGL